MDDMFFLFVLSSGNVFAQRVTTNFPEMRFIDTQICHFFGEISTESIKSLLQSFIV